MLVQKLSKTPVLWLSFLATVLITLTFQIIGSQVDFVFLDSLSDPVEVKAAIASMSASQREFHAWMTLTLDVAYPLAYGALFVGSAYRFFPAKGFYLCLPALICIPVDLMEGIVQVWALVGTADFTQAKAMLTPLKVILFATGLLITIAGWARWLINKIRRAT